MTGRVDFMEEHQPPSGGQEQTGANVGGSGETLPWEALPQCWRVAREQLETTRITRPLCSDDLGPFIKSPHEFRGDMGKARVWRIEFYRKSIAELIAMALARGLVPTTQDFWERRFPQWWFNSSEATGLPPTIAPSLSRPVDTTCYAKSPEYIAFANSGFHDRIATFVACLQPYLPERYDPDVPASVDRHCRVLTAASIILTARRLDLARGNKPDLAEVLGARWLDPDICDPLAIRFRCNVWPDKRYIYVDLRLHPVLANALYSPKSPDRIDWSSPWMERSLPLTEAATRTIGGDIEHTGLRRSDIEISVWCEAMSRMVASAAKLSGANGVRGDMQPSVSGSLDNLPRKVREVAEKLLAASRPVGPTGGAGTRFAGVETGLPTQGFDHSWEIVTELGGGIKGLPTPRVMPLLEGSEFCMKLDWDSFTADGKWMSLTILIADDGDDSGLRRLDFEEIGEDDGFYCVRLQGQTWEDLCRERSETDLLVAFHQATFAVCDVAGGDGCVVVGLVRLEPASGD